MLVHIVMQQEENNLKSHFGQFSRDKITTTLCVGILTYLRQNMWFEYLMHCCTVHWAENCSAPHKPKAGNERCPKRRSDIPTWHSSAASDESTKIERNLIIYTWELPCLNLKMISNHCFWISAFHCKHHIASLKANIMLGPSIKSFWFRRLLWSLLPKMIRLHLSSKLIGTMTMPIPQLYTKTQASTVSKPNLEPLWVSMNSLNKSSCLFMSDWVRLYANSKRQDQLAQDKRIFHG